MKVLFNIYKWFIYIILILIIGSSLWNIIDRASGYNFSCFGLRSCVISSDSMSYVSESNKEVLDGIDNRLYKNDLIFNMEVNSIDDLKVNDIVTYVTDNNQLVTHRVYEIVIQDDKGYVVTKGDANNTVDGLIPFENIKGKYVAKIPGIGIITLYINSYYGLFGISFVLFFIFLGLYIAEDKKDDEENNNNKDNVLDKKQNKYYLSFKNIFNDELNKYINNNMEDVDNA